MFFEIVLSLTIPRSYALTTAGNLTQCVLLVVVLFCVLGNARSVDQRSRLFWRLVSLACALWLCAQLLWTYFEEINKAYGARADDEALLAVGQIVKQFHDWDKGGMTFRYATAKDGELFLINSYIPEYTQASRFNHEPKRARKLLVHKREAGRLAAAIQREGMTLVPLKLYFNPKGIAKLELGIAKGKKLHDKRETEKNRDWQRDKARLMRAKG